MTDDRAQAAGRRKWKPFIVWSVALTLLMEIVTIVVRLASGKSAVEINPGLPLLLQLHHMFWSIPVFVLALIFRRKAAVAGFLWGMGVACIVSDLIHHFIVLPILVGNTGWHWP